jgi:UDP-N-acetylglucosamine 2-epimerase (non-hydrolysing)
LKKLKVVTIVGTRPEIIRLSRLIPKLDEYTDHILVHTGQNSDRQLNEVFFEDLELRQPDYYLNVDTSSMGSVMGDVLKKSEEVFIKEKPDAVMILGDTNSAIAAVVAERMHIPVYHMEAGNRSFDANVPEELNRKMVDHVATFNLPYNDYSMRNLLAEGIHPRFIHKTGSPIREIYDHYKKKIHASTIVEDLGLTTRGYFLVSLHRQENVDFPSRLDLAIQSLEAVRDEFELPVMVSTHPRTRKRLESIGKHSLKGIVFHEPFGYLDYNKLQLDSSCVLSDSGTLCEESSIEGFRGVLFRDSNERPESLETGTIVMSGLNPSNVVTALKLTLDHERQSGVPSGYEVADFSDRVVSWLISTAKQHPTWRGLLK